MGVMESPLILNQSGHAPTYNISAFMSSNLTGKFGGCMVFEMICLMDSWANGEPRIFICVPLMYNGLKNGKPRIWSQCACVKIMLRSFFPAFTRLFPSLLIPEPASIMTISSSLVLISMHVVSPPYFIYSLPETGMDPLEPQHLMITDLFPRL